MLSRQNLAESGGGLPACPAQGSICCLQARLTACAPAGCSCTCVTGVFTSVLGCCPVLQVYLITELVTGGELLEAVLQRGTYSEAEARLAFVQLLKGIAYLHSK